MSELDVIQGFFKKEQKDKIDKYRILNPFRKPCGK